MTTVRNCIEQLAAAERWTYRASRESAAEAAAWSALALAAWGEAAAARAPADWLVSIQQGDGSVGVFAAEMEPRWPTSLALLAWSSVDQGDESHRYQAPILRAQDWCLTDRGKPGVRSPQVGHDATIVGWSWAANTASWLEPTCFHVLALSAVGLAEHKRTCEGRRMIVDRLLPGGGANYGNTIVLGQELVPHAAPTGIAMAALAGHAAADDRIERSLQYLGTLAAPNMTPMSLSWACLGLAAQGQRPERTDEWVEIALNNPAWSPLSACEQALLLLAARPQLDWAPAAPARRTARAES